MNVIDLTHTISEKMPVYPGTGGPKLSMGNSYAEDGFRETVLTIYSHTGTHVDAPNHLYPERTSLDAMPISQFAGSAVIVDASQKKAGELITREDISPILKEATEADFLLFYTGWSDYWNSPEYFGNYPCVDWDILDFVIRTKKKGVWFDTIGIDPIEGTNLSRHHYLLKEHDIIIIEYLTNLGKIGKGLFTFMALPLKFEYSDGAPVRAMAWLDSIPNS